MAKANAAKQRAPEAASVPERGEEVQSGPSPALQEEAQDLRVVEQTTRENSAVQGESAPRSGSTLERAVDRLGGGRGEAGAHSASGLIRHHGRREAASRVASRHPGCDLEARRLPSPRLLPPLRILLCHRALALSRHVPESARVWASRLCTPEARLAITQHLPSVRLADLQISSSDVEATKALLEHLCAAGVVAGLQNFELASLVSSDNKYLDDYREPLHELLKQCGQSLRSIRANLDLHQGKDLQADAISDTISSVFDLTHCGNLEKVTLKSLHFEAVGYAWMRRILESNVSRKFREVLLAFDRPGYSSNIESNLQAIKDAFRSDLCPQLDELFSQKVYENLRLVDFVFLAYRGQAIPDATRWSTLIRDEMPKLDKRGIIQTRLDVILGIFHEYF